MVYNAIVHCCSCVEEVLMKPAGMADTPEVAEVISMADRLSATERLFIARWLLDSILHVEY